MFSEIKEILFPNYEDIEKYEPDNHEFFSFPIQLLIGIKGEEGSESFEIMLCSTDWIMQYIKTNNHFHSRFTFIFNEYNKKYIKKIIYKFFNNIGGADWLEISKKLAKYAKWEFEDF